MNISLIPSKILSSTGDSMLALVGIVTLLLVLLAKEITIFSANPRVKFINKSLNIVLIPLLLVILVNALSKLLDQIRCCQGL